MAESREFVLQKTMIEPRVMRDEQSAFQQVAYLARQLRKSRRRVHHCLTNPGQRFNKRRNPRLRINQAMPFTYAVLVDLHDADFGDAVAGGSRAGGFEVDKC